MIKYIEGDLFPDLDKVNELVLLPHICNNVGGFGAGFVVPLSKHYPKAKSVYKAAETRELGTNQYVEVYNIIIVNMIAQEGIGFKNGMPPIRYEALKSCMEDVARLVSSKENKNISIVAPMFGSSLAGGDWGVIEKMINEIWISKGFDVRIHYFKNNLPHNWTLPCS